MLKIREDGSFEKPNDLRIVETDGRENTVRTPDVSKQIGEILAEHETVFRGIGRIRDEKNNEEMYVKFSMKPEAVPIA